MITITLYEAGLSLLAAFFLGGAAAMIIHKGLVR